VVSLVVVSSRGAPQALEAVVCLGEGALHTGSTQLSVVEAVLITTCKSGLLNNSSTVLGEAVAVTCRVFGTHQQADVHCTLS
jgi:hypothetical protein